MKKVVSFLVLFLAVAMIATSVFAANATELADEVYAKAKAYGVTEADRVQMERYFKDHEVTDAEAETFLAKVDEAVKVMKDAGVTNVAKLNADQKAALKSAVTSAAAVVDVKLAVSNDGEVTFTDESGKTIADIKINTETGKRETIRYTGNNMNIVLVVSSVVAIALVAGVAARKKFANA